MLLGKIKSEVLNFNRDWAMPEKGMSLVKVTENGEICYDTEACLFIVFDETYCYEVGTTNYPLVAVSVLETYTSEYLKEEVVRGED